MPETEPKSGLSCFGVVLFLALFLLFLGLLFPALSCGPISAGRAQAKNDIMGLRTALRAYQTEYGRPPLPEGARFEDEVTQARLLRVLQALDNELNPRRVVFFEAKAARKEGSQFSKTRYKAGIHPKSGAFIDPWGNPYRVRVTDPEIGPVESPYSDVEAQELHHHFIVWSLGKDGVQGSHGKKNILQDSDDVVSWR